MLSVAVVPSVLLAAPSVPVVSSALAVPSVWVVLVVLSEVGGTTSV
ncbi:hypothetical protein [Kribbella sp. NPDC000426]